MNTSLNKQKYPVDISTTAATVIAICNPELNELGIYGQSFSGATNPNPAGLLWDLK